MKTAVAILDLRGDVVNLRSSRNFSFGKILEFISKECTPVMIASDVSPPPRLLQRVASAFSVRLHEPPENYSKRTKSKLAEPFNLSERRRHLKDALAAAVCAYEAKLSMLRRIDKRLSENGLSGTDLGYVARMVISGECNNIDTAIGTLTKRKIETEATGLI